MSRKTQRKRNTRLKLFERQGGLCFYCGRDLRMTTAGMTEQGDDLATFDHIIPRVHGGLHANNLVLACYACNYSRGHADAFEFLIRRHGDAMASSDQSGG